MDVLLSSAYLPPIQYFSKLLCGGRAFIEAHDNYTKQTYRNRCVILDANGPLALTVPTEKLDTDKCPMRDVRISEHGNWRHRHWNALEAAYRHTPFFLYYEDDFRPFYERRREFLYDFNMELTLLACDLIGIGAVPAPTESYEARPALCDLRESIHPKRPWTTDKAFAPKEYYQVFKDKHGFIANMSIVDLLFNMGPESILILNESCSR